MYHEGWRGPNHLDSTQEHCAAVHRSNGQGLSYFMVQMLPATDHVWHEAEAVC